MVASVNAAVVAPGPSRAYRPDVDGLRSVAVIGVLLFHLGFSPLSGGFIGVDVFFVISGYLITQIIESDCTRGKFHYWNFMGRRIARLYPALIVMLIMTMLAGFVLFDPEQYKTLAGSSISAFFSASNIWFWQVAGYFDTSSELNPLLHTWSLGVEQQFYLLWPLLIYAAYVARRNSVPYVLMTIGVLSLVASQWLTIRDPMANFYLTPFRVFEFAVGGLLPRLERRWAPGKAWAEGLLALGFAILLYCFFAYDQNTVFPGVHALLPVTGAALCIFAGRARYLGFVLRNRAAVFIGLISYSLYLVHWPLIVFYKYYVYRPLVLIDQVALLLMSLLLAYGLYRGIENRFRRLDLTQWHWRKALAVATAVTLCIAPAWYVYYQQGLSFRSNERWVSQAGSTLDQAGLGYGGAAHALDAVLGDEDAKSPLAVFAGDSFALQYAAGFDHWLKHGHQKIQGVFQHGCILAPNVTRLLNGKPRQACLDKTQQLSALLKDNNLPLIYALSWTGYEHLLVRPDGKRLEFSSQAEYGQFLIATLQAMMAENPARPIVLIGSQPGIRASGGAAACVQRPDYLPLKCMAALSVPQSQGLGYALNNQLAAAFSHHPKVLFLDPYKVLCRDGICDALNPGDHRLHVRYSDTSHLSVNGSLEVSRVWLQEINRFLLQVNS